MLAGSSHHLQLVYAITKKEWTFCIYGSSNFSYISAAKLKYWIFLGREMFRDHPTIFSMFLYNFAKLKSWTLSIIPSPLWFITQRIVVGCVGGLVKALNGVGLNYIFGHCASSVSVVDSPSEDGGICRCLIPPHDLGAWFLSCVPQGFCQSWFLMSSQRPPLPPMTRPPSGRHAVGVWE